MNRAHILMLILATAALNGCGKVASGGTGTETSTSTGTGTGTAIDAGTDATATASSTATGNTTVTLSGTATVTATETVSSTVTATVTQVNSVTEVRSVTATQTQTQTQTVSSTVTQTQTVPSTVTATQTVSSTVTQTQTVPSTVTATQTVSNTVTQTRTSTVTSTLSNTVTQTVTSTVTTTTTSTSSGRSLVQGTYQSDDCFLDKLASDLSGQSVYMKASFQFSRGSGHKKYSQYADRDCKKAAAQLNLAYTYSYAGSRGGLVVFRLDQEEQSGGARQRYWLVATEKDGDLTFALDGEHGQGGYLWEPTERELQEASAGIERYGIRFRKDH